MKDYFPYSILKCFLYLIKATTLNNTDEWCIVDSPKVILDHEPNL